MQAWELVPIDPGVLGIGRLGSIVNSSSASLPSKHTPSDANTAMKSEGERIRGPSSSLSSSTTSGSSVSVRVRGVTGEAMSVGEEGEDEGRTRLGGVCVSDELLMPMDRVLPPAAVLLSLSTNFGLEAAPPLKPNTQAHRHT